MSDPTRIIVYRNPGEAALWESGMLFPIIASTVIAAVLTVLVVKVWEAGCDFLGVQGRKRHTDIVAMVAAVGIMGYSLHRFGVL